MNRRNTFAVLLAGLSSRGLLHAQSASLNMDAMKAAASLLQTQAEKGVIESAVLHVQRGSQVFQQAFGKARSTEAIFLLGSITKPMTAIAVMVLADRGKLRLSDPVMKFIPEFSEGARRKITLEQVLIHTSGLPDQLPENNELRRRHAPLSEFVQATVRTPLLFEPGTQYHYQSMGILLAAEVVERVAKMSLPDFLSKEVFAPLGMKHSALGLGAFKMEETMRVQTEHAAPESGAGSADAKNWDWNSPYWRKLAAPWGGALCSAGDVALFLRSFLHPAGKVLRPETAQLMIQDHTQGLSARRGIGFALGPAGFGKSCSDQSFGHSGSTGMLAWADPKTDLSCVILTSLPGSVSRPLVLQPVSDVVSG
ncbi:beta-lactamase class C [Roseimicrobium gellanilyticum]|uniref:Beta-lactamase class C n=1 Tax=Roseimicrobium gellanilyticum TaxID=748857 RepID=A0A366HV25_9BACT|nr:serine hydrolase domain-containing protein [Roseimicrobium gellanilyticum]RBP46557.1 beta-lactamase class C [Roseimicrobium gellanilyticum]